MIQDKALKKMVNEDSILLLQQLESLLRFIPSVLTSSDPTYILSNVKMHYISKHST
jgi:hypothetical protein